MKILLFGKDGQVGWELQRVLPCLGELHALGRQEADLCQSDRLRERVRALRHDVIVNAAAWTAVDRAETEEAQAHAVNALAPAVLAEEAARLGSWLVHYSTDYVFDGRKEGAYREEDAVNPLSAYGRGKAAGEEGIRASGARHLILRTSWVYAARGGNFAKTMLRLAAEREQLKVIADQIGAPTGADLLADLSAHMLRATLQRPELGGLYHAVAAGETSWHAYACHVIEFARARGVALKVMPEQVLAIPTTDYPTPAQRPLNSRLSTTKLQQAFGLRLPSWQQGVERMLNEIL